MHDSSKDRYAFIWDMDGTLVDSYPAIVPAAQEVLSEYGLDLSAEYIHEEVIRSSVGSMLERIGKEYSLDPAVLKSRFNVLNDSRTGAITAIPHAAETLRSLTSAGHQCFVYTHRGASCLSILENTKLLSYFTEIVTALDGFPRKPDPSAILYLMDRHRLSPDRCFYVGDRSLDVEAANSAGIGSVLFLDPTSPGKSTGRETYLISDLSEISRIAECMMKQ